MTKEQLEQGIDLWQQLKDLEKERFSLENNGVTCLYSGNQTLSITDKAKDQVLDLVLADLETQHHQLMQQFKAL